MISTIKNNDGFVIAYAEWQILNYLGQFQDGGSFLYIQNIWIHEKQRFGDTFRDLIKSIDSNKYSKSADMVYWECERDNTGKKMLTDDSGKSVSVRLSRTFKREYILNKILKKVNF